MADSDTNCVIESEKRRNCTSIGQQTLVTYSKGDKKCSKKFSTIYFT